MKIRPRFLHEGQKKKRMILCIEKLLPRIRTYGQRELRQSSNFCLQKTVFHIFNEQCYHLLVFPFKRSAPVKERGSSLLDIVKKWYTDSWHSVWSSRGASVPQSANKANTGTFRQNGFTGVQKQNSVHYTVRVLTSQTGKYYQHGTHPNFSVCT